MNKIVLAGNDNEFMQHVQTLIETHFEHFCFIDLAETGEMAFEKSTSNFPEVLFITYALFSEIEEEKQLALCNALKVVLIIEDDVNIKNKKIFSAILTKPFSALKLNAVLDDIMANYRESNSEYIIRKSIIFIKENYCNDIMLEDVSKQAKLSPYYFSKLFKSECGMNFIDYLAKLRIIKARELLDADEISIKEVCYTVGYSDPNYFSRKFKKIVGVTPSEYRYKVRCKKNPNYF